MNGRVSAELRGASVEPIVNLYISRNISRNLFSYLCIHWIHKDNPGLLTVFLVNLCNLLVIWTHNVVNECFGSLLCGYDYHRYPHLLPCLAIFSTDLHTNNKSPTFRTSLYRLLGSLNADKY